MRFFYWVGCCVALLTASSCTISRFLTQAAAGQWQLNRRSQPIDELLAAPTTSAEVRTRLGQLEHVKTYGSRHGLLMHKNYRDYIQLDQPYVVWFVNGSHPLAFLPLTFTFPIVGSFPGISWFDEQRAIDFKQQLDEGGWDVNLRGVTAFSTGGWFRDPVLSTMYFDHPAQVGYFANTILHESVHATVLVPDQQYFNESLASFVADTMTPPFLAEAYASSPATLAAYEETRKMGEYIIEKLLTTFKELDAVYQSERLGRSQVGQKDPNHRRADGGNPLPCPSQQRNLDRLSVVSGRHERVRRVVRCLRSRMATVPRSGRQPAPRPLRRASNHEHRCYRTAIVRAQMSTVPEARDPSHANQTTATTRAPPRTSAPTRARTTDAHTQRKGSVGPIGVDGVAHVGQRRAQIEAPERLIELGNDQQARGWIFDERTTASERQFGRHHLNVHVGEPRLLQLLRKLLNRWTAVHRQLDCLGKLRFIVLERVLAKQVTQLSGTIRAAASTPTLVRRDIPGAPSREITPRVPSLHPAGATTTRANNSEQ